MAIFSVPPYRDLNTIFSIIIQWVHESHVFLKKCGPYENRVQKIFKKAFKSL